MTERPSPARRPSTASVAQLVRDAVVADPSAPAIIGDGRPLSFGELDEASNRVANALIAGGIRRGDRLGFVDRNSTEYWETFIGALKAGAVLVPLNFRLSAAELEWSLDDAGATMIVAGAAFANGLGGCGIPVVVIDAPEAEPPARRADGTLRYADWVGEAASTDPGRDATGDELTELIYSSGTTGRPKGVLVGADQLVWAVGAFGNCFDVDRLSRSLVPVPYYHVAGGGWALITLSRGGCIVQAREPTAASMLRQLVDHQVTHTAMVPAVMQVLTQSPESVHADFSALRQIVYGGSPISEPLLRASQSLFGADLFQSYGLSETMGVTTVLGPEQHRLDGDLRHLRSAGKAISGIELAILDAVTGARLPAGSAGEIAVRGPSVTAGYWNDGAATAAAFTPDGFFRTGDMGVLDAEGFLSVHDRIKDMIITGGENVYPAEVESVIAAHASVLDVAVIGVPSDRWGETPIAVVVVRGSAPDPADIIAWSRERLAHYKCPTAVVFVDELPRNPSGKILKRELRAPFWSGQQRQVG